MQTSNTSASSEAGNDEGEDKDDTESVGDEGEGALDGADTAEGPACGAEYSSNEPTETWITSIYEELTTLGASPSSLPSNRALAVASVDVRAHRVQCATFSGPLAEQDFAEYLDLLKVNRMLISPPFLLFTWIASAYFFHPSPRKSFTMTT